MDKKQQLDNGLARAWCAHRIAIAPRSLRVTDRPPVNEMAGVISRRKTGGILWASFGSQELKPTAK
jgi:hypothetical protein